MLALLTLKRTPLFHEKFKFKSEILPFPHFCQNFFSSVDAIETKSAGRTNSNEAHGNSVHDIEQNM
jgi:hypothetical protein